MSWKATAFVKGLTHAPNGDRLTATEKLMMFVLADSHNDDYGKAWPSMRLLAEQSLLSERQARRVVTSLKLKGLIQINEGDGRGNTNEYLILGLEESRTSLPPLEKRKVGHRGQKVGHPGHLKGDIAMTVKGDIAVSPELEEPPLEPQVEPQGFTLSPTPLPSGLPDWIPIEPWQAFVEMRKKIGYPLTDYALKLAVRNLDKLREQGQDAEEVLNQSVLNCWRGLFPVKGNGHEANRSWAQERERRTHEAILRGGEKAFERSTRETGGGIPSGVK